ncbi:MAG TPA: AAA family ATPase [Dehalococcoidia bacterium]|nr:AAA family ATPase [Dehalococcoidia bacterium]
MDILAGLNPAQREAVETVKGPLLIVAGPGSGKTKVITHRVAYLIKTCGISPHNILAVTFTNKAAREMKERLDVLLGEKATEALTMGTFHAICARILRQEGQTIGLNSNFVIYDDDDQISLIKQCLQDLDLDPKEYVPKSVQSAINAAKSQLLTPKEYQSRARSYFDEITGRVYERYQNLLHRSHALDFDDLLMRVVLLFKEHAGILAKYQSRYVHVMVDEFQDTNVTQYTLVKQLAGKYRNICVVGDPDQSIYSWRFADIRNILSFEKDFTDAKMIMLEQNYRSTRVILDVASSVIRANKQRKEKRLWTTNEDGAPITLVECYDETEEAQFVLSEIDRLSKEEAIPPSACAVMYRINAQSRVLEEAFMRYGVPYRLVGGTRFYQRREIKDIVSYLRLIQNPNDNVSLLRIINIPARNIGVRTVTDLSAWATVQNMPLFEVLKAIAEKKGPELAPRASLALTAFYTMVNDLIVMSREVSPSTLIAEIVVRSGYRDYILNEELGEERYENIMELRTVAAEYDTFRPEEGLSQFLEKISLISDIDQMDERIEAPVLTTLHQAKGLEFPVVFIVGMEEGLLPYQRAMLDPAEIEEERRLCYVGITRAQKHVYLLRAFRRNLFGNSGTNPPSRFLEDIPRELITLREQGRRVDYQEYPDDDFTPVTSLYGKLAALSFPSKSVVTIDLTPGDIVRHATFGDGVVISCIPRTGGDQEIVINFSGTGTKRLLLSLAPLQKL